jgi:hypothetical protein
MKPEENYAIQKFKDKVKPEPISLYDPIYRPILALSSFMRSEWCDLCESIITR